MERLHILDGYGYIFRAYYGLVTAGKGRQGVRLSTSDGMPTGALYVYASMLIRLHLDVRPERIVVVFDHPGKTFRDDIDSGYKANRSETPDDLKPQLEHFRPLTEAFSWPVISVPGVEADDVIASLTCRARERDWDVVIFSADKDLMRLVDGGVTMIDSMRQITYDRAKVEAKFGVPPELVSDWLALVGDSSDNIPGVAGVGAKTAAKLLNQYGSVDGILEHAGELKGKQKERFTDPEQLERLERSRQLATLVTDVELPRPLEELVPGPWDGARLEALFRRFEFSALLDRLGARSAGAEAEASASAAIEIQEPVVATGPAEIAAEADAARAAGKLALYVETDGQRSDRAQVVGMALAVPDRAPLYLPLAHRYLGAPPPLSRADLEPLARVLADRDVAVVCHDAKEIDKALAALEMEIRGLACDSMLAAYLLDASKEGYTLEQVVREAAGVNLPTRTELLGKGKSKIPFEAVAVAEAGRYAGTAAAAVLASGEVLARRVEEEGLSKLWSELERPLARVLADLERRGVCIDTDYLAEVGDRTAKRIGEIETRVFELAGSQINIGSPKQLAALLFDQLGLRAERMKKTKTGYSTDAEVLESMRSQHEIVGLVLEHRELTKLKGTYIDALPPLLHPRTGRLHTSFRQAVAATGRLSSVEPNLQNIPIRTELGREIRRAFVAAPGKRLVSADYSQIELRVMAHLSADPVLRAAFLEGIDVHTQTAAEVFDIPREEVGAHERRVAKAVNYGLIYGQSDFGLSRALDIPRAEARHYIERYFERFARVRAFMDECVADARQRGAAVTLLDRRRPIPGLGARNYQQRTAAERIAQNTPMQGSAADIMKLAMLRVDELCREHPGAAMLLTVHDELLLEVDEDRATEIARLVREAMEGAYRLDVPLVVDVGIADNWADAHT